MVIGTNVVVSALISPHGPPARVIDLVILGRVTPVFDDRIISEYRQVLGRPKFGFRVEDVSALLELFEAEGESVVAPPLPGLRLPDSDDVQFVEVAAATVCDFLITGNAGHFPKSTMDEIGARMSAPVITPADFLERAAGAM